MRTLELTCPAVSLMWLITERLGKAPKGKTMTLAQLKVIDGVAEKCEDALGEHPNDAEKKDFWRVAEFGKKKDKAIILEEAEYDHLKEMLVDSDEFDFNIFRAFGGPEDVRATRKAVFALVDAIKAAKEEKPVKKNGK